MIGVIIGVEQATTTEAAERVLAELSERFPDVRFAVVPARVLLAFEWGTVQAEPSDGSAGAG